MMLFPTQRMVQASDRSGGESHHGGGEDQSQLSDLVAVLVEKGRRSFSGKKKKNKPEQCVDTKGRELLSEEALRFFQG